MESKKVIICAGFGQSGNSAVRDFFKEFDNVFVNNLEDWLIKYAGGLLDLRNTLLHNNNYYTSDSAIKTYLKLVYFYDEHYKDMYKGQLIPLTHKFIGELVEGSYNVKYKPFNWHINIFGDDEEISKRIFVAKRFTESKLDKIIRSYLMSLYKIATDKPYIVLVNSIQNGNLLESMKIFDNAKVITCCRDMRDVYLDFKNNASGTFIPTDSSRNIELFFYSVFYKYPVKHHNILNIEFENFVLDYEKISTKIMEFTGLKPENHVFYQQKFNPHNSIKNISLWKRHQNDQIIMELGIFQKDILSKKSLTDKSPQDRIYSSEKETQQYLDEFYSKNKNLKEHIKNVHGLNKLLYKIWRHCGKKLKKKGIIV